MFIWEEIYSKELARAIMEAGKSKSGEGRYGGDPGELVVPVKSAGVCRRIPSYSGRLVRLF